MKTLSIIKPNAAGIDVGSEKLFPSIAGDEPVVFGTVTDEGYRLRDHFQRQGVKPVAMEATGVYGLYADGVLEKAGIEVIVVNGRYVRNLPGRKPDLSDCQWLATLHAHGLLRGGFVPPAEIRRLQDYQRLRADHITEAASQVQKLQQALERMNIKFHDVISDLTGVSGLKVIKAILAGEREPERLLELCDKQIQKKKSERGLASWHGVWAPEHLFALGPGVWSKASIKVWAASCDALAGGREAWWPPRRWPASWQDSTTACGVTGWSMRNGDCGRTNRNTKKVSGDSSPSSPPSTASSLSPNERWRCPHPPNHLR